jgi:ABC transporter substrate binding protein
MCRAVSPLRHRDDAASIDPVGSGLVASLAKPGGNVTGLSLQAANLAGKRIELLREIVPQLRRLAIIFNVGNAQPVLEMRETEAAALAPLALKPCQSKSGAGRRFRFCLPGGSKQKEI